MTRLNPIRGMPQNDRLEDETKTLLESTNGVSMTLPICPYCNLSVPKKYRDDCHYPIAKRDGGTITVPGHHLCNLLAESQIPRSNWPLIRDVRKIYYKYKAVNTTITRITNLEKSLIRLNALEEDEFKDVWSPLRKKEAQLRKELTVLIKDVSKTDLVAVWCLEHKGIGPITVAGIIATMYPLDRFNRVSSLWHYTGHYPVIKKKGSKLSFSPKAKTVMNELAQSSIKNRKSYLRQKYDPIRKLMEEKHPDYKKGHLFNAAMFRAKKEFLKDLWIQSHPNTNHSMKPNLKLSSGGGPAQAISEMEPIVALPGLNCNLTQEAIKVVEPRNSLLQESVTSPMNGHLNCETQTLHAVVGES